MVSNFHVEVWELNVRLSFQGCHWSPLIPARDPSETLILDHLHWLHDTGLYRLSILGPHICAPYIMAGRTAAEYISLALLIDSLVSIKYTRVWKLG